MKAKTYIVKVAADGTVAREEFNHADPLGQLQAAVGGYIERVPTVLLRGHDLFVNEDGKIKDPNRINVPLTNHYNSTRRNCQWVVGDGVFAAHEPDGEARGLTEAECEAIERMLARLGAKVAGKDAAR